MCSVTGSPSIIDTTEIARTRAKRLPPAADERGTPSTDPVPALHQKLLPLPVGLQVEAGNDPIPDQNRAHEIAEHPLVLWDVSFEAILVIEEEPESLALDDQRVERRQDMNLFLRRIGNGVEGFRTDPVQRSPLLPLAPAAAPYGGRALPAGAASPALRGASDDRSIPRSRSPAIAARDRAGSSASRASVAARGSRSQPKWRVSSS